MILTNFKLKNQFFSIRAKFRKHKILIQNFGYLSTLQIFTIAIPLITIPYLLRILGKETYGLIVFAQTIVSYFLILINFGFNLSATKDVSIYRDDKNKLSEIVSSVLIIKGILFIISNAILWICLNIFSHGHENKILFYMMMYLCLYEWIFPIWYFQGIEQMKYITYVNIISRGFFLTLVFFLVREKSDYLKVPLINGIGFTIAGIMGLWIVFVRDRIRFRWQKHKVLRFYIIESAPLFLGSIAGKVKLLSNKAILGAFVGMESVAIYDVSDKLKDVFLTFLQLIGQVLYPSVSRNKDKNLMKRSIKLLFVLGGTIYVIVATSISLIIPHFFVDYIEVVKLFWILGLLIIIQPLSFLIGTGVLLVNNYSKQYSANLYISTIIYLFFIGIYYIFESINVYSVSFSLLISAIVGISSNIIVCKRKNISDWLI